MADDNSLLNPSESERLRHTWNAVWGSSHYGDPALRADRARHKIDLLTQYGVKFTRGMKVLDGGCGDGSTLAYLHDAFGTSGYGVDVSERALHRAGALAAQRGVALDLRLADVRCLPFEARTFDCVLSWGVIEHFHDYRAAIAEFLRVLRDGGILNLIQPHKWSLGPIQRRWLEFRGRWESGYQIEFTSRHMRSMLLDEGFENVRCFTQSAFRDMALVSYSDRVIGSCVPGWGHYLYVLASRPERYCEEVTVLLIKPDAVRSGLVSSIVDAVRRLEGIEILRQEPLLLSRSRLEEYFPQELYADLGELSLRRYLVEYWMEGPMEKLLIRGPAALDRIRDLVGSTDPADSGPGTIRLLSKDSIAIADLEGRAVRNLVHAPRSQREAERDVEFWFSR